jgi:hypothetical protein
VTRSATVSSVAEEEMRAETLLLGFQRVEEEVRGVTDKDLQPLNLDAASVVTTVLGNLPEIRALRAEMEALPGVDVALVDKLSDYAHALGHAHGAYRAASERADGVVELAEAVTSLRDLLHSDAKALAKRELLAAARVAKLRTGPGYKNVAFDTVGLVQLFRERWAEIDNRTAVEKSELDHAQNLAARLLIAVGLRDEAPALVSAAAKLRQQAFTLLNGAYDEARRAVLFLRWHHGDADQIAPSLWARRSRRRSGSRRPAPLAELARGG